MSKYLSLSGFNTEEYPGAFSFAIKLPNSGAQARHAAKTNLLWPEGTSLLAVLQIVSDDVGLLEEEAHGVGQLGVSPHLGVLQLGCREKLRETDPDQPGNVVAILQRIKKNSF